MDLTEGAVVADRFRLVKMLGQGGMGTVWKAHHTALDIPCAVKFIRPEVANSPDLRARFAREAKAAAQLRSPHVVQILDTGEWDGQLYMAMELLEGEELEERLKRVGRLPVAEVAEILQQISRALGKAHSMGLIHRDLKPSNVFLTKDGDHELAKILDFGIVKDVSGDSHTRAGAMMGTPYYMSPEQAKSSRTIDHRADLWSVGVVVYRCVTGQLPFTAQSIGDLLMKILSAPLPVPSQIASVPAGFDAWWAKAASREPEKRFQTAKEMADALSAVASGPSAVQPSGQSAMYAGGQSAVHPGGPSAAHPGGQSAVQGGGYLGAPPVGYAGAPPAGYTGAPGAYSGGYGAPGYSAPVKPAGSTWWKYTIAGLLVLFVVFVVASRLGNKETRVYVECLASAEGANCTVTHVQGPLSAEACWDVKVGCVNGAMVRGHGCQTVQPQAKASLLIPENQFKMTAGAQRCDRIQTVSVENLVVTAPAPKR